MWTQTEIAAEIGVALSTVNRDLKIIEQRWREEQQANLNAVVNRLVAELNEMRREAWAAWERSKLPREVSTEETEEAGGTIIDERTGKEVKPRPKRSKAGLRREGQCGHSLFLTQIAWCNAQEAKYRGVLGQTSENENGNRDTPENDEAVREAHPDIVAEVRDQIIADPNYLAYLRSRAMPAPSGTNGHASPVGSNGKPGPVANGPPLSLPGPGASESGNGQKPPVDS
jgi:hypothetical protein